MKTKVKVNVNIESIIAGLKRIEKKLNATEKLCIENAISVLEGYRLVESKHYDIPLPVTPKEEYNANVKCKAKEICQRAIKTNSIIQCCKACVRNENASDSRCEDWFLLKEGMEHCVLDCVRTKICYNYCRGLNCRMCIENTIARDLNKDDVGSMHSNFEPIPSSDVAVESITEEELIEVAEANAEVPEECAHESIVICNKKQMCKFKDVVGICFKCRKNVNPNRPMKKCYSDYFEQVKENVNDKLEYINNI